MKKEYITTIEEALNRCGSITYKISGKSMEPMISPGRDVVTVQKKANGVTLQENDVVLYRQKAKLILHRIVEVRPNREYVILGDNCSRREYGIVEDDIIGILTSFKRDGVHYEITDSRYIDYVNRLRDSEYIRTKRKLLYDIIVRHLQFLPDCTYSKIKYFLKQVIVLKISFI